MFRNALLVMALLVLVLGSFIGYVVWQIFAPPWIDIVSIDCPPLTLRFATARLNTIDGVCVYSDTHAEHLWQLDMPGSSPDTAITYGVVPKPKTGLQVSAKQAFPRSKPPRPLEPGEKITILVGIQYDQGFAPSGRGRMWHLQIEADGKAKILPMPRGYAFPLREVTPDG